MHNGDTSFWRNPWKINEPVPGGTSLFLLPRPFSLPHPFPLPHGPLPISLTAARRHSAPCGGCGKNPRRTRINAIMNLSRWDLTIQDVATTPPPRHPIRHDVLRHPARPPPRIYTKTNSGFLRAERSGDNFARLFRTELIVSTRTAALPYIYYISYNFTFLFPLTKNYF